MVGAISLFHFQQRVDRQQPVVADIDMATDGKQPLRDGKIAIAERPLLHSFRRQYRLQLAPQRDAFQKRARLVEPRMP